MEENFDRQIKSLGEEQRQGMETIRNEYSQKMLEDATQYQTLQDTKNKEDMAFHRT